MKSVYDIATHLFHTLMVVFVHTGGPTILAIAGESLVCFYKGWSVSLCGDISSQPVIHQWGGHFVLVATLLNNSLQE